MHVRTLRKINIKFSMKTRGPALKFKEINSSIMKLIQVITVQSDL